CELTSRGQFSPCGVNRFRTGRRRSMPPGAGALPSETDATLQELQFPDVLLLETRQVGIVKREDEVLIRIRYTTDDGSEVVVVGQEQRVALDAPDRDILAEGNAFDLRGNPVGRDAGESELAHHVQEERLRHCKRRQVAALAGD